MLLPTESLGYVYTACYCEENVYKLCEQLVHQSAELYAVFVSNSHKQVSADVLEHISCVYDLRWHSQGWLR